MTQESLPSPLPEDPLLRSARREALVTAALTLSALVYTIGYCALYGYHRTADSLTFVAGMPDWVVWGILAPWLACLAACLGFSYWLEDDTLEKAESTPTDGGDEFTASSQARETAAEGIETRRGEGA